MAIISRSATTVLEIRHEGVQERLITLSEAKTHLGVSGVTDDESIVVFIAGAQAAMEEYLGRHLGPTVVSEVLDGPGRARLWLREQAEEVLSIHISYDQLWTDETLVDPNLYWFDAGSTCIERLHEIAWVTGTRNVRVVYRAGYRRTPPTLRVCMRKQVAKLYSEWQVEKKGMNVLDSVSVADWTESFLAHNGLDPAVTEALNNGFRTPRV